MMRILNSCVSGALVVAAADVYKIKCESTRQAQRVAKLRLEIRRERDVVAALRAEWAKLDNPARIQDLARRHLALKPVDSRQIDPLDNLPERPADLVAVNDADPIGTVIANPEVLDRSATGSVPAATRANGDEGSRGRSAGNCARAAPAVRAFAALRPPRRSHRQNAGSARGRRAHLSAWVCDQRGPAMHFPA